MLIVSSCCRIFAVCFVYLKCHRIINFFFFQSDLIPTRSHLILWVTSHTWSNEHYVSVMFHVITNLPCHHLPFVFWFCRKDVVVYSRNLLAYSDYPRVCKNLYLFCRVCLGWNIIIDCRKGLITSFIILHNDFCSFGEIAFVVFYFESLSIGNRCLKEIQMDLCQYQVYNLFILNLTMTYQSQTSFFQLMYFIFRKLMMASHLKQAMCYSSLNLGLTSFNQFYRNFVLFYVFQLVLIKIHQNLKNFSLHLSHSKSMMMTFHYPYYFWSNFLNKIKSYNIF